jgi:hypothetical protein
VMLVLRVDAGNQHIEHVLAVRCVGSKGHGIDKAIKSERTACTLMQGENAAYNPVGFSALAAPTPASAARTRCRSARGSRRRLKDRYRYSAIIMNRCFRPQQRGGGGSVDDENEPDFGIGSELTRGGRWSCVLQWEWM